MYSQFLKKLFLLNRLTKRRIQLGTDTLLILSAFVASMALRLDHFKFVTNWEVWLAFAPVLPMTLFAFLRLGLYRTVVRYISGNALKIMAVGAALSAAFLLINAHLWTLPIPRSVPLIYFVALCLGIGGIRFVMQQFYVLQFQDQCKSIAIYGAGEAGRQLLNAFSQSKEYRPVMFIDDNPNLSGVKIGSLNVFSFSVAAQQFDAFGVKAIFLAMPRVPRAIRRNIIFELKRFPLEVKSLPSMADLFEGNTEVDSLRSVSIEELLGRDPVPPKPELMARNLKDKTVLVTGAGGSIGSELCRQIVTQNPKKLILLDASEFALYTIHQDLEDLINQNNYDIELSPVMCSVQNEHRMSKILKTFNVETLYHTAAYKHVPLVELNVAEGVRNNVFGTFTLAKAAVEAKVENFILISTDKAVRPTNFMGASKRFAELVCQAFAKENSSTKFSMVRFGNVLGSSGSVIPKFTAQIEVGGPITVTHKDITRYFMTIPEAAQLVLQAGAMAKGGDVFVLNMGNPIKIVDLAQTMARLHGLVPYIEDDDCMENYKGSIAGKIAIKITGLRPGEKLYEELLIGGTPIGTEHPHIMTAQEISLSQAELDPLLKELLSASADYDLEKIGKVFCKAPLEFNPSSKIGDVVWQHLQSEKGLDI